MNHELLCIKTRESWITRERWLKESWIISCIEMNNISIFEAGETYLQTTLQYNHCWPVGSFWTFYCIRILSTNADPFLHNGWKRRKLPRHQRYLILHCESNPRTLLVWNVIRMTFHTSTTRNLIVDLVLEWPMGGYICVPMGGYVWLWVPIYV